MNISNKYKNILSSKIMELILDHNSNSTEIINYLRQPKHIYKMLNLFNKNKKFSNFRNMHTIFPYQIIKALPDNHTNNKYNSSNIYKFTNSHFDLLNNHPKINIATHFKELDTSGFLVLNNINNNPELIYENYLNGHNIESRTTSMSIAKSFVATLIGIAIDDGLINSTEDLAVKYVPELKNSGYSNVKIKHLLNMTSGIRFNENYANKLADINYIFVKMFLFNNSIIDIISKLKSKHPPGKIYYYNSADSQVLGLILHKVLTQNNTNFFKYFEQKLWQSMGAESDAIWNADTYGVPITFAFLNAKLRDFAKLGLMYMNNGVINNKQVIPSCWAKQTLFSNNFTINTDKTRAREGYNNQFWIVDKKSNQYSAVGIWGQYIYMNFDKNILIVQSAADANFKQNDQRNFELFRTIAEII